MSGASLAAELASVSGVVAFLSIPRAHRLRSGTSWPGAGTVQMPFAQDHATGRAVSVADVASGAACNCRCLECGARVIAKKGPINEPHFAHDAITSCNGGRVAETRLHLCAKEALLGADRITIPGATVNGKIILAEGDHRIAHSETEKVAGPVRFDALIRTPAGGEIAVEVVVTHDVDEAKLAKLRAGRTACIRIDLSKTDRHASFATIREQVLFQAPRRWLNHPQVELALLDNVREREAKADSVLAREVDVRRGEERIGEERDQLQKTRADHERLRHQLDAVVEQRATERIHLQMEAIQRTKAELEDQKQAVLQRIAELERDRRDFDRLVTQHVTGAEARLRTELLRLEQDQAELQEQQDRLRRGRLAFYETIQDLPWLARHFAIRAALPSDIQTNGINGQCPRCGEDWSRPAGSEAA